MFGGKPSKVAKGNNGTTRTITWKHRKTRRIRQNPIFDQIYSLQEIDLTRENYYIIFSTKKEPFIPFDMITEALNKLPEWTDDIFVEYELCIVLYHSKDYKKEEFSYDGCVATYPPDWFIQNRLKRVPETRLKEFRLMELLDDSFDIFDDPDNSGKKIFSISKSNQGNPEHTWNTQLCKHFFEWRREKTKYWFTYTLENHYQYITEFLLLHELGR